MLNESATNTDCCNIQDGSPLKYAYSPNTEWALDNRYSGWRRGNHKMYKMHVSNGKRDLEVFKYVFAVEIKGQTFLQMLWYIGENRKTS